MKKELFEINRTTLPFYRYEKDGLTFYEFNATKCQPPEPMINTIIGLRVLKSKNERLVGRYFHEPFPLYDRISENIAHEAIELDNGDFEIVFMIK